MKMRTLGRTGVKVSPLCLGAMMFGQWGNTDHDDSIRIIHAALDAGINFVDTADMYSAGESEEIVGKALAGGRRDDVVLATKFHGTMGDDPNERGNSRRWIFREVEASLKRLRTDWIDLYQVHRWDHWTDHEETLGALTDLVSQGKVRYLGSSTYPDLGVVYGGGVNAGSRLPSSVWPPRPRASSRSRVRKAGWLSGSGQVLPARRPCACLPGRCSRASARPMSPSPATRSGFGCRAIPPRAGRSPRPLSRA